MAIGINVGGKYLDLKPGTGTTHRRTNPIFTSQGSYGYPITAPSTPHNLLLLGNPQILDRATEYSHDPEARIEAYGREIAGTLRLDKVTKDGISFNIDSYEGDFWADAKTRMLEDMDWGIERSNPEGANSSDAWKSYLLTLSMNATTNCLNSDYTIFPVVTKVASGDPNAPTAQDRVLFYMLNAMEMYNPPEESFKSRYITTFNSSNPMYGITPFLYVNTILKYIALHYGLAIERNDIPNSAILSRLCVLNNNVDSFSSVEGSITLNYKYLCPTITISDFIDSLENEYGLQIFINFTAKTMNIVSVISIKNTAPTVDLTSYLTEEIKVVDDNPKPVTIRNSISLENTDSPIEYIEDLVSQYGSNTAIEVPFTSTIKNRGYVDNEIYFVQNESLYYGRKKVLKGKFQNGIIVVEESHTDEPEVLASSIMFHKQPVDIEVETVEVKSLAINNYNARLFLQDPAGNLVANLPCPYFTVGVNQKRGYNLPLLDIQEECPLVFLISRPSINLQVNFTFRVAFPTGAPIPQTNNDFAMLYSNAQGYNNNIYTQFIKPLSDWRAKSWRAYEATLRVPTHILNQLKPWEPFLIGNQAYLFEEIKEQYSDTRGVLPQTFKLRTVKELI